VCERAIETFSWPHAYEIWIAYLENITGRFKEKKVDRIRELFLKCLRSLPVHAEMDEAQKTSKRGRVKQQGKIFYLMYAEFEEQYGLINHAMAIYDRALKDLYDSEEKFEMFNLYLAKATQYFGVTRSRQIFERAFTLLSGPELIQVGLRFAKVERKLGEVERARNVYTHLSQFCNPLGLHQGEGATSNWSQVFWSVWEKFEIQHGDEDSYTDYARVKRSVELRYGSVVGTIQMLQDPAKNDEAEKDMMNQVVAESNQD